MRHMTHASEKILADFVESAGGVIQDLIEKKSSLFYIYLYFNINIYSIKINM